MRRRHLLACLPAALAGGAVRAAPGGALVAAWADGPSWRAGWLEGGAGALRVRAEIELPTRAHGVLQDSAGRLLVVARRPGDWLLRWAGPGHAPQWHWIEPLRAFNGHALHSADGRWLYTTETDLDSGAGLVGVRDATTLAKQAEWPTGGRDPHQLVLDTHGDLIVANGGIETRPETGRVKHALAQMDSSLVRLRAHDGRHAGRWALPDARLSLRHLAWNPARSVLGVALQAEHDDAALRAAAPVLALFDGRTLQAPAAPRPLAGYGGDVAGHAGGWAVSCPRAGGVACWAPDGRWQRWIALPEATALAAGAPGGLWLGGAPHAAHADDDDGGERLQRLALPGLRLDNHWSL